MYTYIKAKSNSLLISLRRSLMVFMYSNKKKKEEKIYGYEENRYFLYGSLENGMGRWKLYVESFVFYKRDGVLYNIFAVWKDAINTHTLPRAFYGIDRQLATICAYTENGD